MGKLILCTGTYAKNPYYIDTGDINIYSIEELNLYIVDNIDLIVEINIKKSLIDWIKEELEMMDLADKLKKLQEEKASNKTIILTILNSCNYYSKDERLEIQEVIEELENLPASQRKKKIGDNFLEARNYKEAEKAYTGILESDMAADLSSEEYGGILHNLGITKIYRVGLKEASIFFKQAYERNNEEESLKQYLMSLKLSNQEDLFEEEVIKYDLDSDYVTGLHNEIEKYEEDYETSDQYKDVVELGKLHERDHQAFSDKQTHIIKDLENRYRAIV